MEFTAEVASLKPEMIVWIDESGFDQRNAIRKFAYSVQGMPPQDLELKNRWKEIIIYHCDEHGWDFGYIPS